VFGVTRIVNFAHGSFYMLGAYFGVTLIPRLLDVSSSFPCSSRACWRLRSASGCSAC